MSIEENVEEIQRAKRTQNFIVAEPRTIDPHKTVGDAKRFAAERISHDFLYVKYFVHIFLAGVL